LTDIYKHFSNFFYPKTVAVIGVSPDENNLGRNIIQNCIDFGFMGEVDSVGASEGVVFGKKIYHSLNDIAHEIDLAIILTPAKTIPEILEQCAGKGIKHVVIESGGFSEMGQRGIPLEKACLDIARKFGIRFIGPNCIGVTNMENGLSLPFMTMQKGLSIGPVSVLAQSGGVGLSLLNSLAKENIGFNKFISVGNKLDVDENELLDYLIRDEGTKIIMIYLEGFTDGRRFVDVAKHSSKPILVYKSNRFTKNAKSAHSHTAALFVDDKLVDCALDEAGCVRINSIDYAVDYIKSIFFPPLKGNRLVVAARSGGQAIIAADSCTYYGFQLITLPKEFLRSFESSFRANVISLQNPLDLGDLFDLDLYAHLVEELLKRDDVDGVLLGHAFFEERERDASRILLRRIDQLVKKYYKPVALFILTEIEEMNYLKRELNTPIFPAPENAVRALKLSYGRIEKKTSVTETSPVPCVENQRAREILQSAEGRDHLLLSEAMDLLHAYGFNFPPYNFAKNESEALKAWKLLNGGGVAMKINRPYVSHKSDAKAIYLNLSSETLIRNAFRNLRNIGGEETEVLLQIMSSMGREIILGGRQDPVFGPIVLFGLGGIFVEVLEDVVWRLAPVSHREAGKMIGNIRGSKILKGVRGEPSCDIAAIEDMLVRVSRIMVDFPEIQEIDINPVVVFSHGKGSQALDARVVLNK